jgi:hypothetical protein
VPPLSQAIVLLGTSFEVCLVWRLLRNGLTPRYPYFSAYLFCVILRTLALYAVQWYGIENIPPDVYKSYYWNTESIGVALRCLVVWELFRHTFPRGSALNRTVSKGLGLIALGLLIFAVATFWSYQAYATFHSVHPALDRSFGFAQSVLILGILLTARYYDIQLGRNLWGIAVGFGAWISISTVNNAMIDLTHSFLPYWQFVRPLSFVAMVAVWTWAVWEAAPNPQVAEQPVSVSELTAWTEDWNRTLSSVRRAGPS